jgi:hypothetical protein
MEAEPNSEIPDTFDVALSFAGPQRPLAERLAALMKEAGFEVFYDADYQAQLWGHDLAEALDKVYRKAAKYCVIFKSQDYLDRMWTSHERRSAVARAVQERGQAYLLPVEVDAVELPGVAPTIAYISLQQHTIDQIAQMLIVKLRSLRPSGQDIATKEAGAGAREQTVAAVLERYLADPYQNRIQIDRLVTQEVERLLPWFNDHGVVPGDATGPACFLQELPDFEERIAPLASMYAVGCRWGDVQQANTWIDALTRIYGASEGRGPQLRGSGFEALSLAVLVYAGGIGAILGRRFDMAAPLLQAEAVPTWQGTVSVAHFIGDIRPDFYGLLKRTEQYARHYQPFSDLLSPLVLTALALSVDKAVFEKTFDLFEYLLALLYVDEELLSGAERPSWAPGGSFLWRNRYSDHMDISERVQRQFVDLGERWPPLQAGLFGGDIGRAKRAHESYAPILATYRRQGM